VVSFSHQANKKLMTQEIDNLKITSLMRFELFNREKSEKSSFWKYIPVQSREINELNNFLISTGYKKKYDKYGYFYEGCKNDEKVFIGGKGQMIVHYCRNFPDMPICNKIKFSAEKSIIDRQLNKDETVIDNAIEDFIKYLDK
jgi:hypothetical protein